MDRTAPRLGVKREREYPDLDAPAPVSVVSVPVAEPVAATPVAVPYPPNRDVLEEPVDSDRLAALPKASFALADRKDEAWNVGTLVETMADWFLIRNEDLRRTEVELRAVHESLDTSRQAASCAADSVRELRIALEATRADRDRYRQERNEWRSRYGPVEARQPYQVPTSAVPSDEPYRTTGVPPRPDPYGYEKPPDPYASVKATPRQAAPDPYTSVGAPPRLPRYRGGDPDTAPGSASGANANPYAGKAPR